MHPRRIESERRAPIRAAVIFLIMHPKRRLASALSVLALAVAIFVGLVFALRDPPRHAPIDSSGAVVPSLALQPVAPTSELDSAPQRASESSANADERTPLSTRVAEPARSVHVTVIDGETRRPAPHATVYWMSTSEVAANWNLGRVGFDSAAETMAHLHSIATCDERAEVDLTVMAKSVYMLARLADRWGNVQVPIAEAGARVQIELRSPRRLTIQVVDAHGAPAVGVSLSIYAAYGHESTPDLWTAVTSAPDGSAVVHDFDAAFRYHADRGAAFRVVAAIAAQPVPSADFTLAELPSATVRLTLPECGALELTAIDERGQVLSSECSASLRWRVKDEDSWSPGARDSYLATRLAFVNGVCVVPFVQTGLELKLYARSEEHRPIDVNARGPLVDGEHTSIELRFGERWPVWTGRILLDGRPFARGDLRALATYRVGAAINVVTASLRTNDQGRFKFVATSPQYGARFESLELIGVDESQKELGRALVSANVDTTNAPHDVGDVVLTSGQLLCSGVVVDENGAPVAGANVLVMWPGSPRIDPKNPAPMENDHSLAVTTASDGSFAILSATAASPLTLIATRNGYLDSGPRPVECGARDLRIELRRSGSVAGRIVSDEGSDVRRLAVHLESPEQKTERGTATFALVQYPREDGTFRFASIERGVYTLSVHLQGYTAPLVTIEGVVVRAGEPCADRRVQSIDLRAALSSFELEVVDDAGKAVENARVYSIFADNPHATSCPIDQGQAHLLLPRGEFFVAARGFRTQRLNEPRGHLRVVMEKATRVRLRLPRDLRLPDPPYVLEAGLLNLTYSTPLPTSSPHDLAVREMEISIDRDDFRADAHSVASGEIVLTAQKSGAYQVTFWIADSTPGADPPEGLRNHQQRVDIVADRDEVTVDVDVDRAWYAEMCKKLVR